MRVDQYEKLKALGETLTDVALEESQPDTWPGHGVSLQHLDMQTRGDRYWCKKNACATFALLAKVTSLTTWVEDTDQRRKAGYVTEIAPPSEADLDKEIRDAEKEAARIMNRLQHAAGRNR
jgi:hypothetical protein